MNGKMRSFIRSIKKTELAWRYGSNFSSTFRRKVDGIENLSLAEKTIVNKLNTDGIAITSVDELFGSDSELHKLDSDVRRTLEIRSDEIDDLRSRANDENEIGNKTFNLEILGSQLKFNTECIFARFALNESFLKIANAYFRMYAKLRYYNVWQTFASNGAARESQLWHFDREDNYILKAFLYLDDVDEGAGPFTYARGTHKKGKFRSIKPTFFNEGGVRRTTDEQMRDVFPEDNWIKGIGKKGTLIFADTRGFHKGGEARTKDRLMYTCMYTSPASESKVLLHVPEEIDTNSLNAMQIRALGLK